MTSVRPVDRPREPGEDIIGYAVATGRWTAKDGQRWRTRVLAGEVSPRVVETVVMATAAGCAVPVSASGAAMPTKAPFRPAPGTEAHYALNPHVDQMLRQQATMYVEAKTMTPPPTLFESGDLPPYTASGLDPEELRRIPWYARHTVAAAATAAEASELMDALTGPDGTTYAMAMGFDRHSGNRDYESRVFSWVTAGNDAAGRRDLEYDARRIAAAAGQAKALEDMTDDEVYTAMFGSVDQRIVASRDAHETAILDGYAVGHFEDPQRVREIRAKRGAA